jgi:hypothetical protein
MPLCSVIAVDRLGVWAGPQVYNKPTHVVPDPHLASDHPQPSNLEPLYVRRFPAYLTT